MRSTNRHTQETISIWPGYVDVLSALIMIIIFVLLIFTLTLLAGLALLAFQLMWNRMVRPMAKARCSISTGISQARGMLSWRSLKTRAFQSYFSVSASI